MSTRDEDFTDTHYPVQLELQVELPADSSAEVLEVARAYLEHAFEAHAEEGCAEPLEVLRSGRLELELLPRTRPATGSAVRILSQAALDLARPQATTVVALRARDALGPVRWGFWAASEGARAIAEGLAGRVIDPLRAGLGPLPVREFSMREDGRVHVGRHICVPASFGAEGRAWLTSLGLRKFGVPELEMREVPGNLVESCARIMAGVGQLLLERDHPIPQAARHQVDLDLARVQWALGLRPSPVDDAPGRASIDLRERRGELRSGGALARRLVMMPPADHRGSRGEWARQLLRDLVGPPRSARVERAA